MITPLFAKAAYARRRDALLKGLSPDQDIVVLFNAPFQKLNADRFHEYHPDTHMLYMTGYSEEESVALLWRERQGSGTKNRMHLFVLPRNREREQWDGFRFGAARAKTVTGADYCDTNDTFEKKFVALLDKISMRGVGPRLWTNADFHFQNRQALDRALESFVPKHRLGGMPIESMGDVRPAIDRLRIIKDANDIKAMRASAAINVAAHKEVMRAIKPGMYEYQLQAAAEYVYRSKGAMHQAYASICASGPNATILHYRDSARKMKAGELFLIDAGCEKDFYASDITRTIPVSGKYSPEQRNIVDIVHDAQLEAIAKCRVGARYHDVHDAATEALVDGLITLKLLKGKRKQIIEKLEHKRYYPHGTSHWLGQDVHDPGPYLDNKGKSLPLQPGMILTVEPGLYFMEDDETVPKEYRGIGVRIEDDIVVTKGKPENLTADLPRTANDIEKFMKRR